VSAREFAYDASSMGKLEVAIGNFGTAARQLHSFKLTLKPNKSRIDWSHIPSLWIGRSLDQQRV
jgi:hypothetical protein